MNKEEEKELTNLIEKQLKLETKGNELTKEDQKEVISTVLAVIKNLDYGEDLDIRSFFYTNPHYRLMMKIIINM